MVKKCEGLPRLLLPVILVATVVVTLAALADGLGLHALAHDRRLLLLGRALLGVGRNHEVATVFDDARRGDAPFQHLRGKLVAVAEVREPDNVVARLAILDE